MSNGIGAYFSPNTLQPIPPVQPGYEALQRTGVGSQDDLTSMVDAWDDAAKKEKKKDQVRTILWVGIGLVAAWAIFKDKK